MCKDFSSRDTPGIRVAKILKGTLVTCNVVPNRLLCPIVRRNVTDHPICVYRVLFQKHLSLELWTFSPIRGMLLVTFRRAPWMNRFCRRNDTCFVWVLTNDTDWWPGSRPMHIHIVPTAYTFVLVCAYICKSSAWPHAGTHASGKQGRTFNCLAYFSSWGGCRSWTHELSTLENRDPVDFGRFSIMCEGDQISWELAQLSHCLPCAAEHI